jgi:AcrR family transcriptional regulator
MATAERTYRGVSAADRRAQRRAQLIDAALDVIGEEGVSGATMKAVRVRSGLTERYFYESFRDRDELLAAVFRELVDEVTAAIANALDEAESDLYARFRAPLSAVVHIFADDPRRARVFVEAAGSDAVRDLQAAAMRAYAQLFAAQMSELRSIGAGDEPAILMTAFTLVGGIVETTRTWLAGGLDLSLEELLDTATRIAIAAADAIAPQA